MIMGATYPDYVYQAAIDYDCSVLQAKDVFDKYGESRFYEGMEELITRRQA